MLGFAWLSLRQAQQAVKQGRLEEAQRLLQLPSLQGQRRAGDLRVQLARGFAERGERLLRLDDQDGAWRDLLQAEAMGSADKACARLRIALTGLGVAEVRALLGAGDTDRAADAVDQLRQRGVHSPELGLLEEALRNWQSARELADKGEFTPAAEALDRARRVLGDNRFLSGFHEEIGRRHASFGELLGTLHGAADRGTWREVLEKAEAVLTVAPQHAEARGLRGRAWKSIEPPTLPATPVTEDVPEGEELDGCPPPRFLLWIDGVGGFLVCLGPRLTFGQAALDARVDVPLIADVSRLHATLQRDAEGYVLEASRSAQVNGQAASKVLLQSGDRFTLGPTCQFLFRLPVPGSTTARLDLVSGHRLSLAVDGVVAMAETLVLGRGPAAHVEIGDLKQPVVLFRHKEGLGVRAPGDLRINGERGPGRALLPPNATVSGEDIAFAVEPY